MQENREIERADGGEQLDERVSLLMKERRKEVLVARGDAMDSVLLQRPTLRIVSK